MGGLPKRYKCIALRCLPLRNTRCNTNDEVLSSLLFTPPLPPQANPGNPETYPMYSALIPQSSLLLPGGALWHHQQPSWLKKAPRHCAVPMYVFEPKCLPRPTLSSNVHRRQACPHTLQGHKIPKSPQTKYAPYAHAKNNGCWNLVLQPPQHVSIS